MLPRGKLTLDDATLIKRYLWDGIEQKVIAENMGISQSTVSRIRRGSMWPNAEWPDKSTGEMPLMQFQALSPMKKVRELTGGGRPLTPPLDINLNDISPDKRLADEETVRLVREEAERLRAEADKDILKIFDLD